MLYFVSFKITEYYVRKWTFTDIFTTISILNKLLYCEDNINSWPSQQPRELGTMSRWNLQKISQCIIFGNRREWLRYFLCLQALGINDKWLQNSLHLRSNTFCPNSSCSIVCLLHQSIVRVVSSLWNNILVQLFICLNSQEQVSINLTNVITF